MQETHSNDEVKGEGGALPPINKTPAAGCAYVGCLLIMSPFLIAMIVIGVGSFIAAIDALGNL